MTFATKADLMTRFGKSEIRTIADQDGAEERSAAVNAALETANAEVAAAVSTANLPSCGSFPLLTQIACDIAREILYDDSPTEPVRERARRGREMLMKIADAKMRVADTDGKAYPTTLPTTVPIGPGLLDASVN